MLTKEQLNILSVFKMDILFGLTFRQIKQQSRQKSNNQVQIALSRFKKENLIKVEKVGNVSVFSLDLNNTTLAYLNILNEHEIRKSALPTNVLENLKKHILKHTEFFILMVFGSYVKHKQTPKSDVDIAIIVESEQAKKEIIPYVETAKRREILPLDCHIFDKTEFLEMLSADFENLGKQIIKSHLIYYGFITYCNLIWMNQIYISKRQRMS